MLHIALYQPEIPPNTGNIIRLCANAGAQLHLIHPMGFTLEDTRLRRAGLDYHEWVDVKQHENFYAFLNCAKPTRLFACSTKGKKNYTEIEFQDNDTFLFGPETAGLPANLLAKFAAENVIKIPMRDYSRSLNLSNAVAIILYEAWRQLGFK